MGKPTKNTPSIAEETKNKDKVAIILAAYNEEKVLAGVIQHIHDAGYHNIIAVDDGSKDNTFEVMKKSPVLYLRHRINRGQGAAVQTGIKAALLTDAEVIVTIDSDGQHNPADIYRLIMPILEEGYDFVLGIRNFDVSEMPLVRILYNRTATIVTFVLFGKKIRDTQSGFRAFSRKAAAKLKINADRYEWCSEMIHEVNIHKFKIKEVPVETIYTEYSRSRGRGQNFSKGIATTIQLFKRSIMP